MRRLLAGVAFVALLVIGAVAGGAVTGAVQHDPTPTTAATVPAPAVVLPSKVPQPTVGLLLLWTPTQLPLGIGPAIAGLTGVDGVSIVRLDDADLSSSADAGGHAVDTPPAGFTIPLEVMAYDPVSFPLTVDAADRAPLDDLENDEILLGSTSARLRRVGIGGTLAFGRVQLRVAAIVDDSVIGAAEGAVTQATGAQIGVTTDRYALIRYHGDRGALETAVRATLPPGTAARFRAPGETPYLRYGDGVLPQVLIKARFGEFAWRPVPGQPGNFEEDPAWRTTNIVQATVPILGRIQCNRNLIPLLSGALAELQQEDLASLVDPSTFEGCWNPRFTRSGSGISRHAWGAAVDINFDANRTGLDSTQDQRLVAVMAKWGFTWGGTWLVPDAAHFEYLAYPS